MRRADSGSASSGWSWGSVPPPRQVPPPHRSSGGSAGVWLAAGLFVAMVAGGVAYLLASRTEETARAQEPSSESASATAAATDAPTPAAQTPSTEPAPTPSPSAIPVAAPPGERSLERITWTVATPATFDELVTAWALPREALVAQNPTLSATEALPAGTQVVVHTGPITGAESVGPPNDGRLIGGIPFPEGAAWRLAPDRTRAFGTGETLVAVLAALDAYAAQFPTAPPIQLGEISARRGGPISGHQSHQAGRDIDIRLIATDAGDRFDGERNWFLVKTLIEGGEVVAIFLNRSQQVWLRAAAEADVGAAAADRYFALISHEPGHIIHMHVRFRCPDSDWRCVAYSLEESPAEVAKKLGKLPGARGKLPGGGGGGKLPGGGGGKLPTLRPKNPPRTPTTPSKPPSKKPPARPTKGG